MLGYIYLYLLTILANVQLDNIMIVYIYNSHEIHVCWRDDRAEMGDLGKCFWMEDIHGGGVSWAEKGDRRKTREQSTERWNRRWHWVAFRDYQIENYSCNIKICSLLIVKMV